MFKEMKCCFTVINLLKFWLLLLLSKFIHVNGIILVVVIVIALVLILFDVSAGSECWMIWFLQESAVGSVGGAVGAGSAGSAGGCGTVSCGLCGALREKSLTKSTEETVVL